ncbi:MAG: helix-turn-helix domain-containing protein, partial [Patescibacteria group bacterium]
MDNISSTKVFTIGQVAKHLGVAKGTVRHWIKTGKLHASVDAHGMHSVTGEDLLTLGMKRGVSMHQPKVTGGLPKRHGGKLLSVSAAASELGVSKET